jgi:acetyl-CoA C-acetyltransferase
MYMSETVITSALRTPIAKYRGELAALSVPGLGAIVLKALMEQTGIDPREVDEVIMGNLFGSDWGNPARNAVLEAGLPFSLPAITVDRQCSSSLNAIGLAASMIESGRADIIIAGGIESYSQQPFYLKRPESPYPMEIKVIPYKSSIPDDSGIATPMIMTAENLAEKYHISRDDCDAFALESHQKAACALREGWFKEQIVPVPDPRKAGGTISVDACIRPDASREALSRLKPVMKPDGVVTAGNSSPMNDGASALLLMSRKKAEQAGLPILAAVREYSSAGCDPDIMGIGPVYSTRRLMERYGHTLDDFDLVELNEAFAVQSLACIRELGLDTNRVNVEGGAIAIGHPNGASGGVLTARMIYALKRRNLKRGLITMCCGGGQGFSLVIENSA